MHEPAVPLTDKTDSAGDKAGKATAVVVYRPRTLAASFGHGAAWGFGFIFGGGIGMLLLMTLTVWLAYLFGTYLLEMLFELVYATARTGAEHAASGATGLLDGARERAGDAWQSIRDLLMDAPPPAKP